MIRNLIALGAIAAIAGGFYWFGFRDHAATMPEARKVLYYKDPMGGTDKSPVPKKDSMGMDYLPVYAGDAPKPSPADNAKGRILYYRNPMGLADTSPTPKKDSMGMDYIPVYEKDVASPGVVQIGPERLQRAGVRTAAVTSRTVVSAIQATGVVALDESRYAVVAPRMEGWVERVHVGASGVPVRAGASLLDIYSPELVQLQDEHRLARATPGGAADVLADGALKRLQNLGIAPSQITDIAQGRYRRSLTLSAPISGVIVKKSVVLGQRFMPGEQLYEIADISRVWVVAKVFEHDLPAMRTGSAVRIAITALPDRTYEGTVSFIAAQINRDTRTADVRIEIANADGALRADMLANVIVPTADAKPGIAVPNSAIIDSGTRQVVLVAKGDGRFEPRQVVPGARSEGYTAIREGLKEGEEIVVEAAFLIDAESNLRSALQSFAPSTTGAKP